MSSLAVSLIAFAVIFGGAFLGVLLCRALPGHHLDDDAKDVVRLGTGLIGTMAALVLGLVIASAKNSYDTQKSQVQHITADIIVLDQLLARYGPETRPIRDLMRRAVSPLIEHIWRDGDSKTAEDVPFVWANLGDAFAKIAELAPQTESQRSLKTRATQVSTDLAQTRLALYVYASNSISVPFLAVLVFWLTITFASFSLFSRLNPTLVVVLFVFVFSASGAIFLVLELSQPTAQRARTPAALKAIIQSCLALRQYPSLARS